jgi:hypothetical protein
VLLSLFSQGARLTKVLVEYVIYKDRAITTIVFKAYNLIYCRTAREVGASIFCYFIIIFLQPRTLDICYLVF